MTPPADDAYVYGPRSFSPGREPALLLIAVIAPGVSLLMSFFTGLDPVVVSSLNAVAVAVAGILTGLWIKSDRLAPAVLGLAQALLTLALAFGWNLTPEQQTGWMTFVGIAVAAYLRTQIIAPVSNTTNPAATRAELYDESYDPTYDDGGMLRHADRPE
jgi:hypothetical protein